MIVSSGRVGGRAEQWQEQRRCYSGSISDMKLSISLTDDDLAALDRYVLSAGVLSRSAAIQRAIAMLPDPEMEDAYASAWDEWQVSGEATAWEVATSDGLADAAR